MKDAEGIDTSSRRRSRQEKKLSSAEVEKQIQRLTYVKEKPNLVDPFPICPSVHASPREVEKIVDRVYTQSLQRKENNRKELDQKFYSNSKIKKISGDELQNSVDRQYEQEIAKRKERREEMLNKNDDHRKMQVKKIPIIRFVQRMYTDDIERKKATEQKLYDKYILPTEIKQVHLSKKRVEEASSRLSSNEK